MGIFDFGLFGKKGPFKFIKDAFGGGDNPAEAARPFLNDVPQIGHEAFDPFKQQGQEAWQELWPIIQKHVQNPELEEEELMEKYEPSKYFQTIFPQLMNQMEAAAGAGGYARGPGDEARRARLANELLGQDAGNWIDRQRGVRRDAMQGLESAVGRGFQGAGSLADFLGTNKNNQANLEFSGKQQQNQNKQQLMSDMIKAIAMAYGGGFGMPGGQQQQQQQQQLGLQDLRSIQHRGHLPPERGFGGGGGYQGGGYNPMGGGGFGGGYKT